MSTAETAPPTPPPPVDPAEPMISGVFAAVTDERDAAGLTVEGELPAGLVGTYLRNGPNPLFPPIGSYTYPLDGDGMVHGLWFDGDGVRYRNRVVWTPQLRVEAEAGQARWAGIMSPYLPGADLVPEALANDWKPLPDINVVRHGGRYLALAEVDPPVEITADLETVGTYDFGGAIPGMCAHPKIDPATGEMVLFRYNIEAPYLTWATVAADGSVSVPPQVVDVDGSYMIHDFVITASYVVVFLGPLAFDIDAMLSGQNPLAWQPEKGMRIAVIARHDLAAPVRWIRTDAFWVWHFANAFERTTATGATELVIDHTQWSSPGFTTRDVPVTGAITRSIVDPAAGTYRAEVLSDVGAEFSRIDDRLVARPHRYFNVTNKTGPMGEGQQNTLHRVDTQTGTITSWVSGDAVFDEVVFIPHPDGELEHGFYGTFRTDRNTMVSDFVLLAAEDVAAGPVARVQLPFRVPNGLHGNWLPPPP